MRFLRNSKTAVKEKHGDIVTEETFNNRLHKSEMSLNLFSDENDILRLNSRYANSSMTKEEQHPMLSHFG